MIQYDVSRETYNRTQYLVANSKRNYNT